MHLGPVSIESPEHIGAEDTPAVAYARPHEIEIERFSPGLAGIPVQLNRLLLVGPLARLELEREDSAQIIEVEMPADKARHLKLKQGETLLISPRKMQVFLDRSREDAPQIPVPSAAEATRQELPAFGTVIW